MDKRMVPKLMTEFRLEYSKCISQALKAENLDDFETSYGLIVRALTVHECLTMKELAQAISRDKSTVTVLVRKLEAKGYVQRLPNPLDHRSKLIALTSKTETVASILDDIGYNVNEKVWRGIKEEDIMQFMNTLGQMTNNLKNCSERQGG